MKNITIRSLVSISLLYLFVGTILPAQADNPAKLKAIVEAHKQTINAVKDRIIGLNWDDVRSFPLMAKLALLIEESVPAYQKEPRDIETIIDNREVIIRQALEATRDRRDIFNNMPLAQQEQKIVSYMEGVIKRYDEYKEKKQKEAEEAAGVVTIRTARPMTVSALNLNEKEIYAHYKNFVFPFSGTAFKIFDRWNNTRAGSQQAVNVALSIRALERENGLDDIINARRELWLALRPAIGPTHELAQFNALPLQDQNKVMKKLIYETFAKEGLDAYWIPKE